MKRAGGFTIVELIFVLLIISLLVVIAIVSFDKYKNSGIKAAAISDLRNCVSEIAASRQKGESVPISQIVSQNCQKSKFTKEIILENEQPLKLRAEIDPKYGKIECEYDESSGKVSCSSPF